MDTGSDKDRTNILVVDDLDEKLLVYRTILDELGQNVVTARTGEEALARILQSEFAVILLDVQMPGMDGFETAAMIRKRRKSMHTPIIFLTAFTDDVRTATGYAHGAVDYMATPVVPEILRAKVRVFVELFRMTKRVQRQAEERVALAEERSRREAAENANRRLDMLARAGAVLGQSLDLNVTVADAAALAVPVLADSATVVLAPPDSPWTVVAAQTEPGVCIRTSRGTRESLEHGLAARIERMLATTRIDFEPGELLLPLRAHGKTFGAMVLEKNREAAFDSSDRTVAEALADRAAIAIENARLYQSIEAADRQKNEFLSMLAHELRNPLAPVLNAAEILRIAVPDHPQVQWARSVITRQMNHMVRLVDDLLDVSRITSGKIRLQTGPVDLEVVLADAVEACRPAIERVGHLLHTSYPPAPVWVNGDSARLTQVFTNLLNNAVKYTDPGGRIWLTLEERDGMAVIRVRDTGIGIPPEMLSTIFELFTQVDRTVDRAQGGLGIGLSVVRRLVSKHGGTVSAQSDGSGKGAELTVRLPTIAPPEEMQGGEPRPAAADLKQLAVLIVDDNVDGAGSLAMLLRLMCRIVYVAHRGATGLELAMEHKPDAIILDIGLPGMSGIELARELRARPETRNAILVALTGYGRDDDLKLSRDAGFDRHLVKPVDMMELRRTLELLIARGTPSYA